MSLNRKEYLSMGSLQNDRNVVIKPTDRGAAAVFWDSLDYFKEVEQQLSDSSIYKGVKVAEKYVVDLVDKSNTVFANLERRNIIQENEKNYFRFNFKKTTNIGKFYLLSKIQKSLSKVPGRLVISNSGMLRENILEFLDPHLQPPVKQGESYIKNAGYFLEKLEVVDEISKGAFLVKADVVGLYPSTPHNRGLGALQKKYDKFKEKMVPTEDIIKIADLVVKNNLWNSIVNFISKYWHGYWG